MVRRLVNEKTLELNITHELMNLIGVQAYGLTQQEEAMFGGDVTFYPISGNPILIQYKATRKGNDGSNGIFNLNNNKRKNQHILLDMIERSSMIDTYYFLPLIINDNFLINNFGNLLNYTEIYLPSQFTGNLNWINKEHKVDIDNAGNYTVHSEKFSGYGEKKEELIGKIKTKIHRSSVIKKDYSEYIEDIIMTLEEQIKEEKIQGQCEHTFIFLGKNENNDIRYFQMPIRLRGTD